MTLYIFSQTFSRGIHGNEIKIKIGSVFQTELVFYFARKILPDVD
jgi:hypothetical protein